MILCVDLSKDDIYINNIWSSLCLQGPNELWQSAHQIKMYCLRLIYNIRLMEWKVRVLSKPQQVNTYHPSSLPANFWSMLSLDQCLINLTNPKLYFPPLLTRYIPLSKLLLGFGFCFKKDKLTEKKPWNMEENKRENILMFLDNPAFNWSTCQDPIKVDFLAINYERLPACSLTHLVLRHSNMDSIKN